MLSDSASGLMNQIMLFNKINILCAAVAMVVTTYMGTPVHGDVIYDDGYLFTSDYMEGEYYFDGIQDEDSFNIWHGFEGGYSHVEGDQNGVEFEFATLHNYWHNAGCTVSLEILFDQATEITVSTYWGGGGPGSFGFDLLNPIDGDGTYFVEAGESFYFEAYTFAKSAELLARVNLIFNTVPEFCRSDCNQDNNVDILDLLYLIAAWGTDNPAGDINSDGLVNVSDLLVLISDWGGCP